MNQQANDRPASPYQSGTFAEPSGSLVDGNYKLTVNGDNILIDGASPFICFITLAKVWFAGRSQI